MVMGEDTASIDVKTEEKILKALDLFTKRCTVLMIAHRIGTRINYYR